MPQTTIRLKELSNKEWQVHRERLMNMLKPTHHEHFISRVLRSTDTSILLEGGTLPYSFDLESQKLRVWSRASRYSGGVMTVEELVRLEKILQDWAKTL